MKILVIHPATSLSGGGAIAHYEFLKSLNRSGYTLVTVSYDGKDYIQDIKSSHYSISIETNKAIAKYSFNIEVFKFLDNIIKQELPELIVLGQINFLFTLYLLSKKYKSKIVHIVHTAEYGCLNAMLTKKIDKSSCSGIVGFKCYQNCMPKFEMFLFRMMIHYLRNLLLKNFVGVFICHSHFMVNFMLQNGFKNLEYVPLYLALDLKTNVIREKKGNTINIIFAGTLTWNKGVYEMVKSFKELIIDDNLTVNIHIVGTGDLINFIKSELISVHNKRYFLHGLLNHYQTLTLLNDMDIVIFPSYFESFGLVALEGMLLKKFLIISNRGSLPEITSNYDCKIVLDSISCDAILKSIKKAINVISQKSKKIECIYQNDTEQMDSKIKNIIEKFK
ncbi:MAG: glycosyltransferase family 4 protein [Melioribacteraceae bacterium]